MGKYLEATRVGDPVGQFSRTVEELGAVAKSFVDLLADMAVNTDKLFPDARTPGWFAKYQVRCASCGKFAKRLRSGDGYDSNDGSYEPWWEVDCKRCGVTDGTIHVD